jgi:Lipocalin-like domain
VTRPLTALLPLFVAVTFTTAASGQTNTQRPVKERLLGTWGLVSFVSFDASGTSRPGVYDVGRVVYEASGQMSAHLMNSANKSDTAPATEADRSAAYRRYLGYYGPFMVDELSGIVIHHVIGSSNPSWVGSDQVRYYELSADGNRLTLSLKNQGRVTSTLTWERIR